MGPNLVEAGARAETSMRAVDFAHNIGAMHWVLLVALSASHDAGHDCCVAAYHRGERCYVVDTANGTAALSGLTPTVTMKNHRVYHLLRYIISVRIHSTVPVSSPR